jgi:hypothetical protein
VILAHATGANPVAAGDRLYEAFVETLAVLGLGDDDQAFAEEVGELGRVLFVPLRHEKPRGSRHGVLTEGVLHDAGKDTLAVGAGTVGDRGDMLELQPNKRRSHEPLHEANERFVAVEDGRQKLEPQGGFHFRLARVIDAGGFGEQVLAAMGL